MSAPEREPSSAGPPALRVMVVEDESGLNRVIRQALERAGFQSVEALSGTDAVRVLADNAPDIVLLDYTLPGMTAEEVLDRIGEMESAPAVIVMTGHGNEKIAAEMLRRGVCDYIVKDDLFFANLMHAVSRKAQDLARARELKRLQAEMADNEARFRALYEEAPLPYQSIDSEGHILQVNHAWLRLLGYEADDVLGRHITSVLTSESRAEFAARFGTDTLEHHLESVEADFVTKSGDSVPVRVFCRVLRDENGDFLRTHCILQDLTEVRRAEAEAHRREQDYRRIVETAQEGVWAMDERMRTTFVNARMCELLGYSEDELVGKPVSDLIADDEMADHEERMRRRMQGISERYVRQFKTADGGVRPLLVAATPILGEHGEFQGSFAMFTDLGELLDRQRAGGRRAQDSQHPARRSGGHRAGARPRFHRSERRALLNARILARGACRAERPTDLPGRRGVRARRAREVRPDQRYRAWRG